MKLGEGSGSFLLHLQKDEITESMVSSGIVSAAADLNKLGIVKKAPTGSCIPPKICN